MADEPELISIGQLARGAGLTTKALRHYDRVGLLTPAVVDDVTGYRFYSSDQVAQARLVKLLRSVDVPLDQVRECLAASGDEERILDILASHRRRLQARLDRTRGD